MKDLLQIIRNGLTAIGIFAGALLLLALMIAPPRIVLLSVSGADHVDVEYDGVPILPGGTGARFVYFGESSVFVRASGYELAEIQFDREANVFRGSAVVSSTMGVLFSVDISLIEEDPNLSMIPYESVLTIGGDKPRQVLVLHRDYRGMHIPEDWVRRQYENETGQTFDRLKILGLTGGPDVSGGSDEVWLDFSGANGRVIEYIPPSDWPASNRMRRVLYTMRAAPNGQYPTRLKLTNRQSETPYQMGSTFFYCIVDGYYCAGYATTLRREGDGQAVTVQIWHNRVQGDPRLRYRY